MNSRIGKYSASIDVVPTSRLELLRLFRPPAPQAGVSTNFTTWAKLRLSPKKLLRNVLVLRAFRRRGGLRRRRRGSGLVLRGRRLLVRVLFLRSCRGAIDDASGFAR